MRVLLADADAVAREYLALLLHSLPQVEVIGEAADGHIALALARMIRPDVIVVAIDLPGLSGIEIAGILRLERPSVRVIGLSMGAPRARVQTMLNAGAAACVSTEEALVTMVNALRRQSD